MYVIGTSGHVDHGKTLLIKALTGIDADRLPEEKERGMTIDLGFAHFEGENGRPIGVIDVPGHERFIRNMVAGAWSLSVALLVVAADEGWMQQSEDHARVLALMGIGPAVLVITKCDLVPEEEAELIREDSLDQCERIFGYRPVSARVSSVTGEGIEQLKQLISRTLSGLPEPPENGPVCYYIDRVFTIRGAGTVVTGSLTGGILEAGQDAVLLPGNTKVQIRSVQSYYADTERAEPVSRAALNLQSLRKEELRRGMCITDRPDSFWTEKEYIIFLGPGFPGEKTSGKRHREVEISYGTDHQPASFYLLTGGTAARAVFAAPAAVRWGQRCLIIRHGGSEILAGGAFVWPGKTTRAERHKIADILNTYPPADNHLPERIIDFSQLELLMKGWIKTGPSSLPDKLPGIEYRRHGDYLLLEDTEKELQEKILKETGAAGGVKISELATKLSFPKPLITSILEHLAAANKIGRREDIYTAAGSETGEQEISKTGQKILEQMEAKGAEGVELKSLAVPGTQKELRQLVRLGSAVPLEGGIYYTRETYTKLAGRILAGLKEGDRFSIPEAKERTGLSRKYMIPLLNRMEQDGYVRREGNDRIVLNQLH